MREWPQSVMATHSGLRGRPGIELTPRLVQDAVQGLVALLEERGCPLSLAVACDDRASGRVLAADVIAAATGAGADAVDLGAISTPAAKLAARRRGLGGAVIVTGSHLGSDWNGLKLVAAPRYLPVDLRTLPVAPAGDAVTPGRISTDESVAREHAGAVCAAIDAERVRAARLRVDAAGGVGRGAELLLEQLGCGRDAGSADVGLRLDADGDRLTLLDEQGVTLDAEIVLPLAALARGARQVVKGADTSRMVDDLVAARGGAVRTVAPGELHLVEALAEGGDLAGEGNGGVVVPEVGLARDALAAAGAILELRARTGRPLSDLVAELPRYVRRRSAIACPTEDAARLALDAVASRLGVPGPEQPEDGIRIETDDAWGLVRRSATEPVLRVTVEAPAAAAAEALHAELQAALTASLPAS